MARPPAYERPDDLTRDVTAVKAAIKRVAEPDRAQLIVWLVLYYSDDGSMFSPQVSRRRKRVAIDGIEYWLVRVPKTRS